MSPVWNCLYVDCKLCTHSDIYREVEFNKGGHNIVSLLMNHLKEIEYFYGPDVGELNICADN